MGDVIDIRRGKKRHKITLQYCPKTAYELGIVDAEGKPIPDRIVDFMRSAEFYLLCKGTRGLCIPMGKKASDKNVVLVR